MAGVLITHFFPLLNDDHIVVITNTGVLSIRSLSTGETLLSSSSQGIRTAAISSDKAYVASVDEKKILRVWSLSDLESGGQWESLSARELPKKPTCVRFTHDTTRIVVSDKFGDVFSYPLHPSTLPPLPIPSSDNTPKKENPRRPSNSLISHPSKSEGVLVLGHTSLLTDFLLIHEPEGYIVTADRDEHIRVSWFPQGYNIESFCLGTTTFVSKVHLSLSSSPSPSSRWLVSGGGEELLRVWEWKSGKQVMTIPFEDVQWEKYVDVYPTVKTRKNGEVDEKKKALVLDTLDSFLVGDAQEIVVFTFVGGRALCTAPLVKNAKTSVLAFDTPIITWSFLPSSSSSSPPTIIVSLQSGVVHSVHWDTHSTTFSLPSSSSTAPHPFSSPSALPPGTTEEPKEKEETSLPFYFEKLDSHPKSIYELMDSAIFEDDAQAAGGEDKKTKKKEGRMKKKAQVLERLQTQTQQQSATDIPKTAEEEEEEERQMKKRRESEE